MSNSPVASLARRKHWLPLTVMIGAGTLIRVPQLAHLLYEAHSFRQTQTAFAIREYSRHGIDLFSTPLPVFGAGSDVPFEFPLFQAIAALLTHTGLTPEFASRLLGFVCFQLSAVLLWILVRRWHSVTAAHVTVALMQFLPFALAWGLGHTSQ